MPRQPRKPRKRRYRPPKVPVAHHTVIMLYQLAALGDTTPADILEKAVTSQWKKAVRSCKRDYNQLSVEERERLYLEDTKPDFDMLTTKPALDAIRKGKVIRAMARRKNMDQKALAVLKRSTTKRQSRRKYLPFSL